MNKFTYRLLPLLICTALAGCSGGSNDAKPDTGVPSADDGGSNPSNPGTDGSGNTNPGTDNPGTDNPGTDNPGTDNPGTDNPGIDNPGTDNPGTDNPGTDNPGTDNPGTDNPGTDNPGTDNPGTDNPGSGNQGTDNPGVNDPLTDGSSAALGGSAILEAMQADDVYKAAKQSVAASTPASDSRGTAKNIILFVGDGMGITTVTAARILQGQLNGQSGEENSLSWGSMPFSGLSKTYNVDAQTADSAGTMTALMTGVKTDAGVLGVDEDVQRYQCGSENGNELVTALELAEIAGMSTGVVTTARITHATPAATYAKSANRDWEDNASLPADANAQGCEDIASQLVNFEQRLEDRYTNLDVDGLEVVMGGGRRHFLPNSAEFNSNDAESEVEGRRTDGVDLTSEWQSLYPQGRYITDQAGFDAINVNETNQVLALFNESHMEYEANRAADGAGEPSLAQMTKKAIDMLASNDKGYFLSVEAARIDHGHHIGSAYGALTETIAFSDAVQVALDSTSAADTLIIVTADHSHVFTVGGYAKRGNPILGLSVPVGQQTPSLADDGKPFTTLSYINGLGFRNFGENTNFDRGYTVPADNGRKDLTNVDTTSNGFHQESLIPLGVETHGGEDVGVYAVGPAASLVSGTAEQNVLFHVMEFAADLSGRANSVLNR